MRVVGIHILLALVVIGACVGLATNQTAATPPDEHAWTQISEQYFADGWRVLQPFDSLPDAGRKMLIAIRETGWPRAEWALALCLSWCESRWNPHAIGDRDWSRGPFQIFIWTWGDGESAGDAGAAIPPFLHQRAADRHYSAWYALQIFTKWGIDAWSTAAMCTGGFR